MADTVAPAAPAAQPEPAHQYVRFAAMTWSEWIAFIIIFAIVAICSYGLGRAVMTYDINNLREQFEILQKRNKVSMDDADREREQKKALTATLTDTQGQLKDAFSPYRTIVVNSNDTISIATGSFTVGLVGPPTGDKITISINGRPETLSVTGSTTVSASSSCQIQVKSFDMFKAALVATCTPTK